MHRGGFLKLVFFVFVVMLAITKLTDADLNDQEKISQNEFQASTLDFANQDTANNTPQSLLFNVSGLVPGGFRVGSVRVAQKGELGFRYRLTAKNFAGDISLCRELEVMILKDWQVVADVKLDQLNLEGELLADQAYQDLVLVLKLVNSSSSLQAKSCGFNLKVATIDDPAGSAFSDDEVLVNQVVTAASW